MPARLIRSGRVVELELAPAERPRAEAA
jgi:hypothetical protein